MGAWIPTLELRADWKWSPTILRAAGAQCRALGMEETATIFFTDAQRMVEWQRTHPEKVKP